MKKREEIRGPRRQEARTQALLTQPFFGITLDASDTVRIAGRSWELQERPSRNMQALAINMPGGVIPVAFGLDRIVTMWLRGAETPDLVDLLEREKRTDGLNASKVRPAMVDGMMVDWLPGFFFSFRSKGGRLIRISEGVKFFGRTLQDAVDSQFPTQWERHANYFCDETIHPAILTAVMEKFREGCIGAGVVPKRWEGPGQGASVLMSRHQIKEHLSGWRVENEDSFSGA